MLSDTLEWRVKFQAESITGASVHENGKTGKVFVSGIDLLGRPILYMRPGNRSGFMRIHPFNRPSYSWLDSDGEQPDGSRREPQTSRLQHGQGTLPTEIISMKSTLQTMKDSLDDVSINGFFEPRICATKTAQVH